LPPEVFPHNWRRGSAFLNYPVFSWEWFRRRAVVYLPLSIFFGAVIALRVEMDSHDWSLAAQDAVRTISTWVFVFHFGAGLSTWIRHRGYPPARERVLILSAIASGTVLSFVAWAWCNQFYREVVWPVIEAKGGTRAANIADMNQEWTAHIDDVLYVFVILLSTGGLSYRMYLEELRRWADESVKRQMSELRTQRDDADRKLTVLQAQIEPHFLYNTLASVRSLVASDPERAGATIDALVDHLRATLPKMRDSGDAVSTLSEQADICRSYLDVMTIRMGERLTYSVDIPSDVASLPIPPLMLLSLVENSIKHGVEPKLGSCSVAISAQRSDNTTGQLLEVTVVDTGAGLREGPSDGVGIANIRAQLVARYGQRAAIDLTGREYGGAIARVTIPIDAQR
jgi:signal transduction histidine kinase